MTNSLTDGAVAGASVSLDPTVEGVSITTSADGTYTAELPIGVYALTFAKENFKSATASVSVVAEETATRDVALVPVAPVVVAVEVEGDAAPGATLTASVTVTPLDGSTVESTTWSQGEGAQATFGTPSAATTSVVLADLDGYKEHLFQVIEEPPITEDELPPDLDIDIPEASSGLLDRFVVQAINPFELEKAESVALEVTVTTSSGTYEAVEEVLTPLPWKVNPGLQNVPVGVLVLLHGKDQETYDWALAERPGGSQAALTDATTQNPYFTPDVEGAYTVTVTDSTVEPSETVTLELHAGTWVGAITGQDVNGRPESAACTGCHNDIIAPDKFTDWKQSGHAEIFTNNLNANRTYSTSCFVCHSVGYDTEADNGGFDDATGFDDFLAEFPPPPDPDNWTNLLTDFPDVAQLANVQCENCHGPNETDLHNNTELDPERISISSNVCGACHGEPLRHARFQQWQLSRHSNYDRAIETGTVGFCARCHSGQGFIHWSDNGFTGDVPAPTADEVHPQTCATCHPPHNPGNLSGDPNNAIVRVEGDTPLLLAGFTARNVGRGAICMTCHNTRRGLTNDIVQPFATFNVTDRAPHTGAQADVVMGQNAYFVTVGVRGKHSLISDTCTNCHMQQTAPPALLSYNQGGTNHTFQPSVTICENCHDSIEGEEVQAVTEAQLEPLKETLEESLEELITTLLDQGVTVSASGLLDAEENPLPDVDIEPGDSVSVSDYGDSHGHQAVNLTVNGTFVGHAQVDAITIFGGVPLSAATDQGQVIVRAGWNLLLVEQDSSGGIHNPSFALGALSAAQTALDTTDFGVVTERPFKTDLTGDQEVPPVETDASGNAVLTLNDPQTVLSYRIEVQGFAGGEVTQAHIHVGSPEENGPIVFFLCTDLGNAPASVPTPQSCANLPAPLSGTLTAANFIPAPDKGVNTFEDAISALLFGNTYVNVHSVAHPGGEVRGQVGL